MTGQARVRMAELFKHEPKLDYEAIAKTLNSEGYRTKKGAEFTVSSTSYYLSQQGLNRFHMSGSLKKAGKDNSKPDASDILIEVQMIMEMSVADERKLSLVKTIVAG